MNANETEERGHFCRFTHLFVLSSTNVSRISIEEHRFIEQDHKARHVEATRRHKLTEKRPLKKRTETSPRGFRLN